MQEVIMFKGPLGIAAMMDGQEYDFKYQPDVSVQQQLNCIKTQRMLVQAEKCTITVPVVGFHFANIMAGVPLSLFVSNNHNPFFIAAELMKDRFLGSYDNDISILNARAWVLENAPKSVQNSKLMQELELAWIKFERAEDAFKSAIEPISSEINPDMSGDIETYDTVYSWDEYTYSIDNAGIIKYLQKGVAVDGQPSFLEPQKKLQMTFIALKTLKDKILDLAV